MSLSPSACVLTMALLVGATASAQAQESTLAAKPGVLTGLRASGMMDKNGVLAKDLSRFLRERPGAGVEWRTARVYRSATRVLLEVDLKLLAGDTLPWIPGGATLVSDQGQPLEVLSVQAEVPLRVGVPLASIWVEAVAPSSGAQETFTLKLWEKDGTRALTLDGVIFP